ncbi:MAG: hypothetical protein AAGK92_07415 [Pseudomonadota bacterium]
MEEIVRFQEVIKTGKIAQHKDEAFYYLSPKKYGPQMWVGKKAWKILRELSEDALQTSGLSGRVASEAARSELDRAFFHRFLLKRYRVNDRHAARLIRDVVIELRSLCVDRIHFIPCHLMSTRAEQAFHLGPVQFVSGSAFRKILVATVHHARKSNQIWNRDVLHDTLQYYRGFDWTAKVFVTGHCPETSVEHANSVVRSSLDFIHLLFGSHNTAKMQVGGALVAKDTRGMVFLDRQSSLGFSGSIGGQGEVGFGEDWLMIFYRADFSAVAEVIGIVLQYKADKVENRPIATRVLEAAEWFGEACRHPNDSVSIVSYVTALETLLMTDGRDENGDRRDICETLSKRVGAACCFQFKDRSYQSEVKLARQAYALRSNLVHGAPRPGPSELSGERSRIAKLTKDAILSTMMALGPEAMKATDVSVQKLSDWYEQLVLSQTD